MINKINPVWFLLMGVILMTASHTTFSIGTAAWMASVPFLIYLSITRGFKSRLLFSVVLIIAWSFIVLKIITPPLTYAMIFLFSIPIGLIQLPGYLLWAKFKNRKWAYLLFPATMVFMEWIQYTFTPFASWGVAAYTQMDNLIIMQSVSLFGMAGLSFLIYWMNITIAEMIIKKDLSFKAIRIPLLVLAAMIIFGSLRYTISKSQGQNTITVAAVCTDSKIGGLPLPSKEITEKDKASLFSRTRTAGYNGAKLVAWNEASIGILPEDEKVWKDSLSSLAAELKIALIASYVVPVSESPLKYENKYLLLQPDGKIAYSYLKHQPVPGEPAIKGKEPLQVIEINETKIGGAICYDYNFPYLAKEFARKKADIVAVPSSDWRGIDPIHTKMAAFRAIEQGHSILRSTRFGLSGAITPYGEIVSQMSSYDDNDKIMMAHLPVKSVTTLYGIIGDVFVYLCIGFILFFLINAAFSKK